MPFWSRFKNIHEDANITKEDKFEYLLQSMIPNTRASDLVNSYPPTEDNYDKVIDSLKNRYGKNELLVEVYVRELLKLVLNNAMSPKGKILLSSVYDKLESQMRSLESLGVTTDTCAAMLYPLVESSLPEELLRAWQRQSSSMTIVPREQGEEVLPVCNTPKDRLNNLMLFLQKEVENEERIAMAVNGFSLNKELSKEKMRVKQKSENKDVATASTLLAAKEHKIYECIFCGEKHGSVQCNKARKMTFEERMDIVKQKNACFNCLRTGHSSRFCKLTQRCAWCSKRHVLLMCRENDGKSKATKLTIEPEKTEEINPKESNLANLSLNTEIFLPTLCVRVHNGGRGRIVRAV